MLLFGFDNKRLWAIFASNRGSLPMRAVLAVVAALITASLTMPAFAQQGHVPQYGEEDKEKTAAQKAADKAAAAAYQRSLGAIPDKAQTDPWGTVRSNDAPAATKAAKTKAKGGNAEAKPQ
jgi:hypothetical protein